MLHLSLTSCTKKKKKKVLQRDLPKPELRPSQAPLVQRKEPLSDILPRRPGPDVDGEDMVKGRMGLPRIGPLEQVRQGLLPFLRRSGHGVLEGVVEADGVRQRPRVAPGEASVVQVVHGHAGRDDLDVLVAQLRQRLAEAVVLDWVFAVEERDLHDRHVQGVGLGVEGWDRVR